MPLVQREAAHHGVGQHGDLFTRAVDGGHALARDLIHAITGADAQRRGGNVHADARHAVVQPLHRQAVVDLGGAGIIDGKGFDRAFGQMVEHRRLILRQRGREIGPRREMRAQEALFVNGTRAGQRPHLQQQPLGRQTGLLAGQIQRTPAHGLTVGGHQQVGHLAGDERRQLAGFQLGGQPLDFLFLQALALDGGQRGLEGVGLGRTIAATPLAVEVHRHAVQAHQHGGLLHDAGIFTVVLGDQQLVVELFLRGHLPQEINVDVLGLLQGLGQHLGGAGRCKAQHDVGLLDLDALAGGEFHLQAGTGVLQDGARLELTGLLE